MDFYPSIGFKITFLAVLLLFPASLAIGRTDGPRVKDIFSKKTLVARRVAPTTSSPGEALDSLSGNWMFRLRIISQIQ